MSERRRALMETASVARADFRYELQMKCCVCGEEWRTASGYPRELDVHEMIGGSMRCITVGDRRAWLLLCRRHHEDFQNRGLTPYVVQFAYKYISDREYFDLEWLIRIGGWGPEYITERDVMREVHAIQRRRMRPWER